MKIRKILVPVDFEECSTAALEEAIGFAKVFDATLELLHVLRVPAWTPGELIVFGSGFDRDQWEEVALRNANTALKSLAEEASRRGASATYRAEVGVPADAIVAASAGNDIVVMGTHGRGVMGRILLGSVANDVSRRASCPVLTVRAAALVPERTTLSP